MGVARRLGADGVCCVRVSADATSQGGWWAGDRAAIPVCWVPDPGLWSGGCMVAGRETML